jgi:hypothetical protein
VVSGDQSGELNAAMERIAHAYTFGKGMGIASNNMT